MACYNLPKRGRKGVNNICDHYVPVVFGHVLLTIKSTIKFTIEVCVKPVWLTERTQEFLDGIGPGIDKSRNAIDADLSQITRKYFVYFMWTAISTIAALLTLKQYVLTVDRY
jgi:hypothetical protein